MLKTRISNRLRRFSFADSRAAARRYMKTVKWPVTRNLSMLIFILAGSLAFVELFAPASLEPSARHALFILLAAAALLPISTPPNALIFSTGIIRQKDFRLPGAATAVTSPFLILFFLWALL